MSDKLTLTNLLPGIQKVLHLLTTFLLKGEIPLDYLAPREFVVAYHHKRNRIMSIQSTGLLYSIEQKNNLQHTKMFLNSDNYPSFLWIQDLSYIQDVTKAYQINVPACYL